MKHCTLPTLLAVKTTILPTVPSSRAGQKQQKLWRLVKCVLNFPKFFLINSIGFD